MGCLSFLFAPKLGEAELKIVAPNSGRRIPLKFILRTYELTKHNVYSEIAIPGLSGAPLQFIRGQPQLLSMTLFLDARQSNSDVRELTKSVSDLMKVDSQLHTPPVLLFEWKGFQLKCVLESTTEKTVSVFPDGRPSRAKMHIALKEMRTPADLLQQANGD